ncbi:MAG: hypothetical protein J0L70_30380, partial [Leptolyngbya sp. UWPOB_LEPTO1]|uniref:hypothetical protein n=1 Tax=Leptolyngbya sp. UWPOB_LEPTO1 TaxID=2815653 RepID=UPI001AC74C45
TATFDGVGSNRFSSIAGSTVEQTGEGKGGMLTVNAGSLTVSNGAQLTSATFGRGDAGDVTLIVRDTATFDGVGSNRFSSIAGSTVEQTGEGKGGMLTVNAGSLTVSNGAQLTSATFGRGDAGDVTLTVRDTATFDGVGSNGFSSGAGSTVERTGVGRGGNLTVSSGSLTLRNGAFLNSSAVGQGDAGNFVIRVRDRLELSNRSIISTASQATNGGSIDISAKTILLLDNSNITTYVFSGEGKGGDIRLNAGAIAALNDSNILTLAPQGQGGDIVFKTRAFLSQPLYRPSPTISNFDEFNALFNNGQIDINASGAISGAIVGVPNITFLQNNLTQLSQNAFDPNIFSNSCIARDQKTGAFYITGRSGLIPKPGELSNYSVGTIQAVSSSDQRGAAIVEPQGVYPLPDGRLILSRECP